ncbi:MAG: hypothetical protein ACP5G2_05540 [Candidatus Bipolaricaulaceae bacterium]
MLIQRWRAGKLAELEDTVAEEAFLRLRVNGRVYRHVALTPEAVRPFVVGHLHAAGVIAAPQEISRYAAARELPWLCVDVEVPAAAFPPPAEHSLWPLPPAPPSRPA